MLIEHFLYDVVCVLLSSIFKYRHTIYNNPFITHEDDKIFITAHLLLMKMIILLKKTAFKLDDK